MEALTWVAVVLSAVALAVVLWLRRGVQGFRASMEKVVQGIVLLRKMAGRSPRLVPLPEGSPDLAPLVRAEPRLEAADLHAVGDTHELGEDGAPSAAMRWLVSGDGTVFGWLGVGPAGPAMLLVSELPDVGFVTTLRGQNAPSTATPPTVAHQAIAWDEGLDAALEAHRGAVSRLGEPLTVEGLDGAVEGMDALKAHVAEWRNAQDPAALLEGDVRKILGARYDELGETVIRLVRYVEQRAGSR